VVGLESVFPFARGQRVVTRVAAIDCGTNSIRLLIADVDQATGMLSDLVRTMRVVRLGEGIDRTGEFSQGALARTFAACDEYAALLAAHGNPPLRFVATSATRDAGNRADFMAGVRSRLGVEPDVIPGAEEAELSFVGAVRGLPRGVLVEPVLVVDIGGGSTEFVLGGELPSHSISVNVGCVRMTERHLRSDPPSAVEVDLVEADLEAALATVASAVPVGDARTLVGVAGSVTTVAAMALDLLEYDPAVLHGAVVTRDQVERVTAQLLAMTRAQRAALPFMHEGRVDVIAGGAMVLRALMRAFGTQEVIVSETDILDGIVYRLAALNS
jgi:exopolyphosphatase/guanosine-5'-triphosphate,3'-diphosphate pyrophosphatase